MLHVFISVFQVRSEFVDYFIFYFDEFVLCPRLDLDVSMYVSNSSISFFPSEKIIAVSIFRLNWLLVDFFSINNDVALYFSLKIGISQSTFSMCMSVCLSLSVSVYLSISHSIICTRTFSFVSNLAYLHRL